MVHSLLGLWLALLLNHHIPFKSVSARDRAVAVDRADLCFALGHRLGGGFIRRSFPSFPMLSSHFYRSQKHLYPTFSGEPWPARVFLIVANIWRGIPFVAITLLAGLQTISPSLYEAALLDGASGWQRFRRITVPLLLPNSLGGADLVGPVHIFRLPTGLCDHPLARPFNSTHLMATLALSSARSPAPQLGEGAAIAVSMIPFLIGATFLCLYGVGRRKWQQGSDND